MTVVMAKDRMLQKNTDEPDSVCMRTKKANVGKTKKRKISSFQSQKKLVQRAMQCKTWLEEED